MLMRYEHTTSITIHSSPFHPVNITHLNQNNQYIAPQTTSRYTTAPLLLLPLPSPSPNLPQNLLLTNIQDIKALPIIICCYYTVLITVQRPQLLDTTTTLHLATTFTKQYSYKLPSRLPNATTSFTCIYLFISSPMRLYLFNHSSALFLPYTDSSYFQYKHYRSVLSLETTGAELQEY